MRRLLLGWMVCGACLLSGGVVVAQSSLDALEQELNEAKQQHQEVTSQVLSTFFNQIDNAMASPDAAVALYQQAGGNLPKPTPVVTEHEEETVTEKDARLAQDQANLATFGALLQLHCGLMHYAALFVVKPDQKGLQDDWTAWLQKAAEIYPQVGTVPQKSDPRPDESKRKKSGPDAPPAFNPEEIKGQTLRDSLISKFLGFKAWADKEQGGWTVGDLPKLYRADVLEPLRATPSSATLAAWDVYIAMVNADEKDNDKWNQVVYPPLGFDRACDDYAVTPSTEKLEVLVNMIKANPTYPQVEDWIARVHQMMADYRSSHEGRKPVAQSSGTSPTPLDDNPNVSVTTIRQGDMTIVTTHTNSAPINPPAGH